MNNICYCRIYVLHFTKFLYALKSILGRRHDVSDDNCPQLRTLGCDNITHDRTAIVFIKVFKLCNKVCNNFINQMKSREATKAVMGSTQWVLKFKDHHAFFNKIILQT